ncbi:universal stress protein [Actinopolymorpha sp. B11F2]|uniref:universal stress protein n=1 Tax=Actinopolymorpha sp. B11F2 TaxID=3160862 RepID=UPI0032E4DB4A
MVEEHGATVVVGVDGSPAARLAVAWAVQFAGGAGATVHAVAVCGVVPASPFLTVPTPREEVDLVAEQHHDMIAEALRQADPQSHGVAVRTSVIHGEPGRALCALSAGASALVVGSHGRGAVLTALLGSVSAYCVRHAKCPVFVIPPDAVESVDEVTGRAAADAG